MEYLFTDSNSELLRSFSTADTLFGFDFDGTLAPIVKDPNSVKIESKTAELFKKLVSLAPVAILTGRSVADISLRLKPTFIIGNHGLEQESFEEVSSWKKQTQQNKKFIEEKFGRDLTHYEVQLEDKGLSLSLHLRNSSISQEAETFFRKQLQQLTNARIIEGKKVFNILPLNALDKGLAFAQLLNATQKKLSIFVGDDITDEDVFSLDNPYLLKIRVGKSNRSNADFYINDQSEIEYLLQILVETLFEQKKVGKK